MEETFLYAIHTNALPYTGMLNSEDKSICLGFSQCTSLNLAQDTNLGLVEIHAELFALLDFWFCKRLLFVLTFVYNRI